LNDEELKLAFKRLEEDLLSDEETAKKMIEKNLEDIGISTEVFAFKPMS